MARYNDQVMRRIKELYWPRLDDTGSFIEPGQYSVYDPKKIKDAEYDPNVVWVGPFTDAMVHFSLFPDRQLFKSFMYEVNDKGPGQGFDFTYERIKSLEDTDWPHLTADYPPQNQVLRLASLSGAPGDSVDPGEVMVSPRNKAIDDIWGGAQREPEYVDIKIAVDDVYNLHILRRGDRIRKSWKHPQLGVVREVYVLRPVGDGESRVPMVRGEQPIRV